MYLEKLPEVDDKRIDGVQVRSCLMKVIANREYVNSVEPDVWFNAFKEHYSSNTEIPKDYIKRSGEQSGEIFVGNSEWDWIINFKLDLAHGTLGFFYNEENPFAKDLVVGFINKLGNFH